MNVFRKKLLAEIVIALTIIGAILIGILFFGWNVKKYAEEIAVTRQELAVRSISLQSLALLRTEYREKAEPYLNVLYNVVPSKDQLIDLSKDFQVIASSEKLDYGFTFLGESPPSAETLGSVKFGLNLGGELNALLNFLKNIQNFRYLINLENISLTKETNQSRMELRGGVFFR